MDLEREHFLSLQRKANNNFCSSRRKDHGGGKKIDLVERSLPTYQFQPRSGRDVNNILRFNVLLWDAFGARFSITQVYGRIKWGSEHFTDEHGYEIKGLKWNADGVYPKEGTTPHFSALAGPLPQTRKRRKCYNQRI